MADENGYITKEITFCASPDSKCVIEENVLGSLSFKWEENDEIRVYCSEEKNFPSWGGNYSGTLDLQSGVGEVNGVFRGVLRLPERGSLRFCYSKKSTLSPFSCDISVQDGSLNNIINNLVAYMDAEILSEKDVYSGVLKPLFSVMKVAFSKIEASKDIYVCNTYTKLNVNTATGEFYCNNGDEEYVTLRNAKEGVVYYLALYPRDVLTNLVFANNNCKMIRCYDNVGLKTGCYYTEKGGGPINVVMESPGALQEDYEGGIIGGDAPAVFSVSAKKRVAFSSGNLWFQAGDDTDRIPKWSLAEKQYHCLITGDANTEYNKTPYNSGNDTYPEARRSVQSKWIDLFGWGCTGYNYRVLWTEDWYYQPFDISSDDELYGPVNGDLKNTNMSDWGAIAMKGGCGIYCSPKSDEMIRSDANWYTLNMSDDNPEFNYLLNELSNDEKGARNITKDGVVFYRAYECDLVIGDTPSDCISGLIIMEDYSTTGMKTSNSNRFKMWSIPKGAVFLPYTGYRVGDKVHFVGCNYWSRNAFSSTEALKFIVYGDKTPVVIDDLKSSGSAVRLVMELL